MPLKEFWYGDVRLLKAYQMAHYRNVSYNAWLQGQYNSVAYGVVLANAFSKNGSTKSEYPQWKDPMERFNRPKTKKDDNLEQHRQNEWFYNMFHKE